MYLVKPGQVSQCSMVTVYQSRTFTTDQFVFKIHNKNKEEENAKTVHRLVASSVSGFGSFGCSTHLPLSISTLMSSSKSTLGSCCALLTPVPTTVPLPPGLNTLGLGVFSDRVSSSAIWVLHTTQNVVQSCTVKTLTVLTFTNCWGRT